MKIIRNYMKRGGMNVAAAGAVMLLSCFSVTQCMSQIDYNGADWGVQPMDYSRVGSAGWQFLKLPTNARNTAMGGVKSALGYGDANAAFNNPASAADISSMDVQFSSMKWVADIKYSGLSAVRNFGELGVIGLNMVYLNYGEMVRTEIGEFNGVPGVIAVTSGLGTFSAHDLALGVMYARRITDQLELGGNVRFLEEQLDDAKAHTWGMDIGTMYRTGLGSLRISMLGRNFGPDGEFLSYENRIAQSPARVRMPMMFVVGGAYDFLNEAKDSRDRLTVAAEYVKPNDGTEKVNVGIEYFMFHNFYVRGGYRLNYDEEKYTLGFGAEYSIEEDVKLKADYAYANLGRFNYVNMFSIGIGF